MRLIGEYKCIVVDSMTGDCPQEWIDAWIKEGYDLIHYVGNGCNTYMLMDQVTEIKM